MGASDTEGSGEVVRVMQRSGLAFAASAVLAGALLGWLVSNHVHTPKSPRAVRPLAGAALTSQTGETVRVEDYRGKVLVLVFGCVSCWTSGGSVLDELSRALRHLHDQADEVQVLVVSIDPQRDAPDWLAAYVTAFDPRFVGVVGSSEAIGRVAALGLTPDSPDAAPVIVLDQRGYLRLLFPFRISAPSLAEDLAALLRPMRS